VNNVGYAANVVEVPVRNKERADFALAVFKIFSIGQNVVDTRCVVFFKLKAGVDNNDFVTKLNHSHVAADFFYAAERDNANVAGFQRRNWLFIRVRRAIAHFARWRSLVRARTFAAQAATATTAIFISRSSAISAALRALAPAPVAA